MTDQVAADQDSGEAVPGDAPDDSPAHDACTVAPIERRFGRVPRDQRISKWDRPAGPHDWRFYVGTAGKVLIATGLLMFGFVAYQLWGTGIETAIAQNRLEDRFDAVLAERPDAQTVPATESPTADTTSTADTTPSDTTPSDQTPAIAEDGVTATIPIAVDLSDDAVEQAPIPQPFRGEPLLRLEIPAIGRDDIVVPGVTPNDLQEGPGHYPDTPLPGQLGNAAIAGHRTTYGAPFFDVDQLEPGDEIITTLLNGDRFVYEVTSTEIVSASDYWVVTTRDPDIAELTLTSCHPKFTARDRIIVHSVLNPEKSSNVGLPTFYTLDEDVDAAAIAGDDPVLSAGSSAPGTTLGDERTTETTVEATVEVTAEPTDESDVAAGPDADGAQPRPVSGDDPAGADPADAFSRGWFDDRDAFVQIVLWGLVLVIISLAARRISRHHRRDSIGILVGVTPFVVALYFFYQNVNRLLPPGI